MRPVFFSFRIFRFLLVSGTIFLVSTNPFFSSFQLPGHPSLMRPTPCEALGPDAALIWGPAEAPKVSRVHPGRFFLVFI